MDFMIFALYTFVALFIGTLGIIMGFKKIDGAPLITILAGFLFLIQIIMIDNIAVGYTYSANTTYNNSTDTITETQYNPQPINEPFNQNDVWVFSIMLGLLFVFMGIAIQFAKL